MLSMSPAVSPGKILLNLIMISFISADECMSWSIKVGRLLTKCVTPNSGSSAKF